MTRRRIGSRTERGQGMVELALILPILVLLLLGIFDLGRVVWANDGVANAAREGARWAIVHGGSLFTKCPVGPPSEILVEKRMPLEPSESCPHPSPSKEGIHEIARQYLKAAGDVEIQVCYGQGCSGDVDTGTNARGESVTVTVSSRVDLVGGGLIGFGSVNVSSSVTMIVSN